MTKNGTLLAAMALLLPLQLRAAPGRAEPPVVELATGADWVRSDGPVELRLERSPAPSEGRFAVLVAGADLTDLFVAHGTELVYRADLLPLPVGESELVVFLVRPDGEWTEIARFPLRVLTREGLEERRLTPRLDLQGRAVIDADHSPPGDPGPEETESATLQLDFEGVGARSGWRVTTRANVVGVTEDEEALRFGDEGQDAPRVDLSSYVIEVEKGRGSFALGSVSFGEQRHLISGFSSRGARLAVPIGSRGTVAVAAMNGTSIVGWDNILGLDDQDHQVLAGDVAFDLLPNPGALRLGLSYVDGSLLPLQGFTQGLVTDTEESDGWGLRLGAATPSGRFRADASFSRSTFTNPFDPSLAQGDELVEVREEERDARFVDLSVGIVQGARMGDRWTADLTLRLSHERVEPQYRSVAAFTQADREQNGAELAAALGPINLTATYTESEDNLDDVPSILKTETDRQALTVYVPFAQLADPQSPPPAWLPMLSLSWDDTHQRGVAVPDNGGFSPSHVPDQVSENASLSLDWQGSIWRVGYRLALTDQDNRQPGRENDDFEAEIHGLSLGLTPWHRLDLGLDGSWEDNESIAEQTVTTTTRYGFNLGLRLGERFTLTGLYSESRTDDDPRTAVSESSNADLSLTYQLTVQRGERHGFSGQLYVRYSEQDFESSDQVFGFDVATDQQTVTAGLSLSVY